MLAPLLLWLATPCVPPQWVIFSSWESPRERKLAGRIVTTTGEPIDGATVSLRTLMPFDSVEIGHAVSAPDGRFDLDVTPAQDDGDVGRRSFLAIDAPGFAASRVERVYEPAPSYDIGEIVLYPPVELRGSVVDEQGRPIAGAEIHAALGSATCPYGDHARKAPIAISDANGAFVCRALPPGLVTLGASASGRADCVLDPIILSADSNRVRFVTATGRTARLDIVTAEGKPVAGAKVQPLGDIYVMLDRDETPMLAFWRAAQISDDRGVVVFEGLAENLSAGVVVVAPNSRPAWATLALAEQSVRIEPSSWLDIALERKSDRTPVDIYQVRIRDGTRARSWCGNCEAANWLNARADSPCVRVVSPSRWQVEWNGAHSYVGGAAPSAIAVTADDGTEAHIELAPEVASRPTVVCSAQLDAPASLSGRVQDADGNPLSIRLGVQLTLYSDGFCETRSGPDGRFAFERLAAGSTWIYALEDGWQIDNATDRWELKPGSTLAGATIIANQRPPDGSGVARVRLTIDGKPPQHSVLVALDDVGQDMPAGYPRSFAWTDAEGRFEISAPWPRSYHLVPKYTTPRSVGGWRDFGAEFPPHGSDWPWMVEVPESGAVEQTVDLPPETEWSQFAPGTKRDR
ncbi:MAG: carboxypeptidase regulatory-like domain-containing protein [Planctomycetes bacterium]|nr:carboxypeptidase regulatory-like domain-containing protein [Planctomycetota bacterium]